METKTWNIWSSGRACGKTTRQLKTWEQTLLRIGRIEQKRKFLKLLENK